MYNKTSVLFIHIFYLLIDSKTRVMSKQDLIPVIINTQNKDVENGKTKESEKNETVEYVDTFCPVGYMMFVKYGATKTKELRCVHCKELLCTPCGFVSINCTVILGDQFCCAKPSCLKIIEANKEKENEEGMKDVNLLNSIKNKSGDIIGN